MRFLMFSIIGIIGFFVDTTVLYLGLLSLHLSVPIARLISYLVAASITWVLHRRYTFRIQIPAVFTEWVKFLIFNSFGGVLNYTTSLFVLQSSLPHTIRPAVAVAIGSVVGLSINYFLCKRVVFYQEGINN